MERGQVREPRAVERAWGQRQDVTADSGGGAQFKGSGGVQWGFLVEIWCGGVTPRNPPTRRLSVVVEQTQPSTPWGHWGDVTLGQRR